MIFIKIYYGDLAKPIKFINKPIIIYCKLINKLANKKCK